MNQQLHTLESLDRKTKEYEETYGDLPGAYRDLSNLTEEQLALMEEQAVAYDDNKAHAEALTVEIENEYGSIENAIEIRDNYNKRLENSKEATKLLETATSEEAKAIIEEGLALQSTMNYAQYLVDKKKALESQTKLTVAQEKELSNVNKNLQSILGDSAVAWNSETQSMEVSATACQSNINYQYGVANAKITQANTMAEQSNRIMNASAEECETIIANCTAEIAALEARAEALDESYGLGEQLAEQRDKASVQMMKAKARLAELNSVTKLVAEDFKGLGNNSEDAGKKSTKASEDALKAAQESYTQQKELAKSTHEQQISQLDDMVKKYNDTAQHQIDSRSFARDEILNIISEMKESESLTLDEEIAMYDMAKEKYCVTESDKAEFSKQINKAIKEDVDSLTKDILEMSNDELLKVKETLSDKEIKYKDYKDSVEYIQESITEIVKEEAQRQYDSTAENVDKMKDKYAEIYNSVAEGIDAQTQSQVDAIQEQIDAIENGQTARDLAQREQALRDRVANAETSDERMKAQQELDDWLLEQSEKTQIQQLKAEMANVKQQGKDRKAEAKNQYDEQLEELDRYLALEKEKLDVVKKANYEMTDEEITKIAAQNLMKREQDNQKSLENMQRQFENQKPILETIFNSYGDLLLNGIMSRESDIESYFNSIAKSANLDGSVLGSHAGGASFIGQDGLYRLHQGERVLSKSQNQQYNQVINNNTTNNSLDNGTLNDLLSAVKKLPGQIARCQQVASNMA